MGCHKLFKNHPKIFCFPKFIHVEHCSCLDKYFITSSHQVLVCFDIPKKHPQHPAQGPQRSIRQLAKEILFPKVVHIEHCPRKYFTSSYQIPVCCFLVRSTSICIALFSNNVSPYLEIPQRNFVAGLAKAQANSCHGPITKSKELL